MFIFRVTDAQPDKTLKTTECPFVYVVEMKCVIIFSLLSCSSLCLGAADYEIGILDGIFREVGD